MKSLKNHMILYDADCPMCKLYTSGFAKTGMLEQQGVQPYQQMPAEICPYIDQQRAVNEIALVDRTSGEVTYGIHSLFKVLGNSMPVFKTLFACKPFIWIMTKVYAFISYNRKVIIPAAIAEDSTVLQPTFKLWYRLSYLTFTWFAASCILTAYVPLLKELMPVGGQYREYLICGGQIVWQAIMICLLAKDQKWTYLGNMMTISFAGALLLLPAMLLANHLDLPALFYAGYFLGVAGLMFLEHYRRMALLKLGIIPTLSWVLYRIVFLLIILFI
ncbi:MAG: DUF393 domain-containing protein [Bacteroidota bacterium]